MPAGAPEQAGGRAEDPAAPATPRRGLSGPPGGERGCLPPLGRPGTPAWPGPAGAPPASIGPPETWQTGSVRPPGPARARPRAPGTLGAEAPSAALCPVPPAPVEAASVVSPISQMRKLRLGTATWLSQGHGAKTWHVTPPH